MRLIFQELAGLLEGSCIRQVFKDCVYILTIMCVFPQCLYSFNSQFIVDDTAQITVIMYKHYLSIPRNL